MVCVVIFHLMILNLACRSTMVDQGDFGKGFNRFYTWFTINFILLLINYNLLNSLGKIQLVYPTWYLYKIITSHTSGFSLHFFIDCYLNDKAVRRNWEFSAQGYYTCKNPKTLSYGFPRELILNINLLLTESFFFLILYFIDN